MKELGAFENFPRRFELFELALGRLEFFLLLGDVLSDFVDLVEHHFDRGFLDPGLSHT